MSDQRKLELPKDRFINIVPIGSGQGATVYAAYDLKKSERVAIKHINAQISDRNERERVLLHFEREIRAMLETECPNVLELHELIEYEDRFFFVLPLCIGTLDDLLARRGYLREDEAASIVKQLLRGLHDLHRSNIIHRDIKPSNVLLTRQGVCKLSDFNLSTILEGSFNQAVTICGTPFYLAPELAHNRPYDYKADIWSLGVLTYVLVTGSVPFSIANMNPVQVLSILRQPDAGTRFHLPGKEEISSVPNSNPAENPYCLQHGLNWSPEIQSFLELTCCVNPTQRASARDLCQHPWISRFARVLDQESNRVVLGYSSRSPDNECVGACILVQRLMTNMIYEQDTKLRYVTGTVYTRESSERERDNASIPISKLFPLTQPVKHTAYIDTPVYRLNFPFNAHGRQGSNNFFKQLLDQGLLGLSREEAKDKFETIVTDYETIRRSLGDSKDGLHVYLDSLFQKALITLSLVSLFKKEEVLFSSSTERFETIARTRNSQQQQQQQQQQQIQEQQSMEDNQHHQQTQKLQEVQNTEPM